VKESPSQDANHDPPGSKRRGLLQYLFSDSKHQLRHVYDRNGHCQAFLREDLNVKRLNDIHWWLWVAGLPHSARPLHRQLMMSRSIIVTEQADLHLTWEGSYMYIKPLPRYLLCSEFWKTHLQESTPHDNACGFLLSYSWLICYKNDFVLATTGAQVPPLLPDGVTWEQWQTVVEELYATDTTDEEVSEGKERPLACNFTFNKRYKYGELRLSRLNKIYRFVPLWWYRHLIRGYHYGYHRYSSFFSRNFAPLIVAFAYITVVLTVMQVGLAVDPLKDDSRFINTSYGFSVFSMVLIAAVIGIAVLLAVLLFLYNLVYTVITQIGKLNQARKRKKAETGNSVQPGAGSQGAKGTQASGSTAATTVLRRRRLYWGKKGKEQSQNGGHDPTANDAMQKNAEASIGSDGIGNQGPRSQQDLDQLEANIGD